jgi:hypothetical protein
MGATPSAPIVVEGESGPYAGSFPRPPRLAARVRANWAYYPAAPAGSDALPSPTDDRFGLGFGGAGGGGGSGLAAAAQAPVRLPTIQNFGKLREVLLLPGRLVLPRGLRKSMAPSGSARSSSGSWGGGGKGARSASGGGISGPRDFIREARELEQRERAAKSVGAAEASPGSKTGAAAAAAAADSSGFNELRARSVRLSPATEVLVDTARGTVSLAPRGGGWGLQLSLTTPAERETWAAALRDERQRLPLSGGEMTRGLRSDFAAEVHAAVWQRIEQRNDRALWALYYDALPRAQPLVVSLYATFEGLMSNGPGSAAPSGPAAARAFAAILSLAANFIPLRAILLAFRFQGRLFAAHASAMGGGRSAGAVIGRGDSGNAESVMDLCASLESNVVGAWGVVVAPVLLKLLRHPAGSVKLFGNGNAAAAGAARADASVEGAEGSACPSGITAEEIAWFYAEASEWGRRISPLALKDVARLMDDGVTVATIFGNAAVRIDDPARVRELFQCLPLSLMRRCFSMRGAGEESSRALVECLIKCSLRDRESFGALCQIVVSSEVVDDAFVSALADVAFAQGQIVGVKLFLDEVLFDESRFELCNLAIMSRTPQLVPVVMEALAAAVKRSATETAIQVDSDGVRHLFELLLRLECFSAQDADPEMHNVRTLSAWLSAADAGSDAEAHRRSAAFVDVVTRTRFLRNFARICAPNEPLMADPAAARSTSASPAVPSAAYATAPPAAAPEMPGSWHASAPPMDPGEVEFAFVSPLYGHSGGSSSSGTSGVGSSAAFSNAASGGPGWGSGAFAASETPRSAPPRRRRAFIVAPGLENDHKARRRQHLLDALYGLLASCLVTEPSLIADFLLTDEMNGFFRVFFRPMQADMPPRIGQLRERVAALLLSRLDVHRPFAEAVRTGRILSKPRQFSRDVIAALRGQPTCVSSELFVALTLSAVKLGGFDGLARRIGTVELGVSREEERKAQLLGLVNAVMARPESDFFKAAGGALDPTLDAAESTISLETLGECALLATSSKRLLSKDGPGAERLQRMFNHYLETSAPSSWRELFRSAETVAYFIKYINRENLPKTYESFKRVNASRPLALGLIEAVEREYSAPLLKTSFELEGGDAAMERMIAELEARGAHAATPQMKSLIRLSAAWMRNRQAVVKIPMAPRNAQSVAFLACAHWQRTKLTQASKALICQVGTGEGKSLLIAMLAVHFASLGKSVHVLENNAGLLERDYADFAPFYKALGATSTKRFADRSAQITYALREDIEQFYRGRVFEGLSPFANAFLLVDEVDELIVDASPNENYVKPDVDRSAGFGAALAAVKAGSSSKPGNVSAEDWSVAQRASRSAAQMLENVPNGYAVRGGRAILLDGRGRPTRNWSEALAAKNFLLFGHRPELNTYFFTQSMPHMLLQYGAIVGLSGTLGSPSERDFLQKTFGASFVEVPSFLDTCEGVCKMPPKLVENRALVLSDDATQIAEVARLAAAEAGRVPTVVITSTPQHAARVRDAIAARLRGSGGADAAQLFTEMGADGRNMDWRGIVERATAPIELPGGRRQWRVTVTDYFGGRGHDYRVQDEEVNEAGGLLVIMMTIPESEREFVQWRGRTARNDRRGQFAVLLNGAEEPVSSNASDVEKHKSKEPGAAASVHDAGLIETLLAARDKVKRTELEGLSAKILHGQRLNELCDKFYKANPSTDGAAWPGSEANAALRDFLTQHAGGNVSAAECATFAKTWGVPPATRYS